MKAAATCWSGMPWGTPFPTRFGSHFLWTTKPRWLHEILASEGLEKPILAGQSVGGYVAQCYFERFPSSAGGFVSIDSAPLQKKYTTAAEIWLLRRMEPVYRLCPWKTLLKSGSSGVADTEYGKQLMLSMMNRYSKPEYCALTGHGFRLLADATATDRPTAWTAPASCCAERMTGPARPNDITAAGQRRPVCRSRG
ncbi:MAG: hypothetical protein ACLSE7_01850 [Lachnospirales bacterium]